MITSYKIRQKKLSSILKIREFEKIQATRSLDDLKKNIFLTEELIEIETEKYHRSVQYYETTLHSPLRENLDLYEKSIELSITKWADLFQKKIQLQKKIEQHLVMLKKIEKQKEKINELLTNLKNEKMKSEEIRELDEYKATVTSKSLTDD